ncbi:MAG: AI-2E family transporter, partial [Leptolyngbyaceae cyanobacterium]
MMTGRDQSSIVPPLVAIAAFIIIVAGLKAASELLSPVLLSLFIVLVTSPLVQWMRARRVPTWLANLIVILGVIATGLLLIIFLIASVAQLTDSVPAYRSLLEDQLTQTELWLARHGLESADILNLEILRPSRLIQFVLSVLTGLIGTLGNVGLTLFIVIYMLVGASSFATKLKHSLGERSPLLNRMTAFSRSV